MDKGEIILFDEAEIIRLKKKLEWYEKRYPYIEKRGVHNWKNLFRKPTLSDWVILIMLILALFSAWAYNKDISICREYVKENYEFWKNFTNGTPIETQYPANLNDLNITIPVNE